MECHVQVSKCHKQTECNGGMEIEVESVKKGDKEQMNSGLMMQ